MTYENLFRDYFGTLPDQGRSLEDCSKDELIGFIHRLKETIETLTTSNDQSTNADFGVAIIATTAEQLEDFVRFCRENYLPVSERNSLLRCECNQTLIDDYLSSAIDPLHLEYALMILLDHVQLDPSCSMTSDHQSMVNGRNYTFPFHIIKKQIGQSPEDLLRIIRLTLLGEQFVDNHHDHASVPSLPSPRQPQFVSISSFTDIACWSLPRRRDLNRFRDELRVTHILTLQNHQEVKKSNICQHIQSAGIVSIHIPIEGADQSVLVSSNTIEILRSHLPSVRTLLLQSTAENPVKMLIHCAAGLHRTGTITYLLLRMCHFTADQALLIIHRTRAVTARQVAQKRIEAAETVLLSAIR